VVTVDLPSTEDQDYWISKGSALLCQLSDYGANTAKCFIAQDTVPRRTFNIDDSSLVRVLHKYFNQLKIRGKQHNVSSVRPQNKVVS